jgi:hypothetical protein
MLPLRAVHTEEARVMSRPEDESWKIIDAFGIVCALLTALIIALV